MARLSLLRTNFILTAHIDTIRSFQCYFVSKRSPATCSKLVDIFKKYVCGDVYQTGWLFHEYNQKVASLYKSALTARNTTVEVLIPVIAHAPFVATVVSESGVYSSFLKMINTTFNDCMMISASIYP